MATTLTISRGQRRRRTMWARRRGGTGGGQLHPLCQRFLGASIPARSFDDLAVGKTKHHLGGSTRPRMAVITDTATLTVTVTGANDGLTANDDSGTTTENTDLTVADGATGTTWWCQRWCRWRHRPPSVLCFQWRCRHRRWPSTIIGPGHGDGQGRRVREGAIGGGVLHRGGPGHTRLQIVKVGTRIEFPGTPSVPMVPGNSIRARTLTI